MLNIEDNKCTGCKMCADVCPKAAIDFEYRSGFWYPVIDKDKCIDCGLCDKMCPALNKITNNRQQPVVYAAWTKDTEQRLKCTSGGMCYELSKAIIDNGGYVAGVQWGEGFKSAEYTIVNDYEGLKRITQTKYFQADSSGIYKRVKELLDKGETVLFVGTPCCNVALQKFLKKDYDNLYNCEFVCRGISSPRVYVKSMELREKEFGAEAEFVQHKNKNKGWSCFGTYIRFKNGKTFYEDRYHSVMTKLFTSKDMNTRPSCYDCQYREIPRYADVTVGDFWGIEGVEKDNYFNGVSLLMLNSDKGKKLFELIKKNIEYRVRTVKDVEKGNPCLLNNPRRTAESKKFFDDIENMSFKAVLEKYALKQKKNVSIKQYIKRLIIISKKIVKGIEHICRFDVVKYIYYNFFCKSVIRDKGCFIEPYRGTCIEIDKSAKLFLHDRLRLNCSKMKGSKAESYLKLCKNAVMEVNGRVGLLHSNSITVNKNAHLVLGHFGTNVNTNIVCSNEIVIGYDVMAGRNVTIYDNDYHYAGKTRKARPIIIGDHVWIGSGSTIMKNVKIGTGSIISANSVVIRRVKERTMVYGNPAKEIQTDVIWSV